MEVINPVIIAGGKPAVSANTFRDMGIMLGDHSQMTPIVRYATVVTAIGPLLHILRPGDYTVNDYEPDAALLNQYGVEHGSFSRLYMAANICFKGTSNYLNLCGVFDKSYAATYMRGFYYVDQKLYERALPLMAGLEGCAAVSLTSLYSAYCEAGLITLDDIKRNWREYTAPNIYYLVLEE